MNSITYEVEFSDVQVKEYSANLIAENILTQVDLDGYSMTLMEGIIDYQKDDSIMVAKQEKYITIKSRQRRLRRTTSGWHLLIKWRDGTESWVTLADMKESHPVETAKFTHVRGIDDEAAFAWCVWYNLCKHDVILSAVTSRLRKTTHKYGIKIPNDVSHAMELDCKNGNTMWKDALAKEMFNVRVAFEVLEH